MSLELRIGQCLKWGPTEFQVSMVHGDKITLLNEKRRIPQTYSLSTIEQAQEMGEITFKTPPIDHTIFTELTGKNRKKTLSELDRRRRYVDTMMLESKYGCRRVIKRVIHQVSVDIGDPKPPGVTSVFTWVRNFLKKAKDIYALVPRYSDRGSRKSRLTPRMKEMLDQTMRDCFLTRAAPTKTHAYEHLTDLIRLHNDRYPKLYERMISYKAFCRYIQKYIDPYHVIRSREGVREANRRYREQGYGIVSTYPLERVEIDHTLLDIQIVDEITGEIIGRPTLTWAMDHYSRVILGYLLTFASPKSTLITECIRRVLVDKSDTVSEFGIAGGRTWDMHGVMREVVVDNGADFQSDHFKRVCEALNVTVQYCPPGKPWYKGRVERWVGTLNTGLIHMLPGTTRSNTKARGDYPSEELAILTLNELNKHITTFIVTKYHEQTHTELGMSPRACWEEGVRIHRISQLQDPSQLDWLLAKPYESKISDGRIQIEKLRYASPLLTQVREQFGKKSRPVEVLMDPNDISKIWVKNPINNSTFEVPCRTPNISKGMTLDAYLLLRKLAKKLRQENKLKETTSELVEAQLEMKRNIQRDNKRAEKQLADRRKNNRKHAPLPRNRATKETSSPLNKKENHRLKNEIRDLPVPELKPADTRKSRFGFTDDDMSINKRK